MTAPRDPENETTFGAGLRRTLAGAVRCLWDPMAIAVLSRRFALEERARHAFGLLVDVGSGAQPYRSLFGPTVRRYVALDLPSRQPGEREPDVGGNAMALPLRSASVDTVLCVSVLMYLDSPARAFGEFDRVLNRGGKLIVIAQQIRGEAPGETDRWRFSRPGLAALAADAGLAVIEIAPCNGIFGTLGHLWSHWLFEALAVRRRFPSPLARALCAIALVPCWLLERTGWGSEQTMYWLLVGQKP